MQQLAEQLERLTAQLEAEQRWRPEAEARLAATSARGDGDELLRARQELRAARRAADAFRDEARAAKAMQVR